jgi:peroxiredoxin
MVKTLFITVIFTALVSCGTVQKSPEQSNATAAPVTVQKTEQTEENLFELELETVDGESFSYKTIAGKKLLFISFWATWCEPCKAELTKLAEIYPKYKENLEIIAISIDPEDNMDAVQEFAVEIALPYPVLIDPSGNVTSNMIPGGDTVPYSMLLDKNGKIIVTHTGYEPGDETTIEKEIQKLLQ